MPMPTPTACNWCRRFLATSPDPIIEYENTPSFSALYRCRVVAYGRKVDAHFKDAAPDSFGSSVPTETNRRHVTSTTLSSPPWRRGNKQNHTTTTSPQSLQTRPSRLPTCQATPIPQHRDGGPTTRDRDHQLRSCEDRKRVYLWWGRRSDLIRLHRLIRPSTKGSRSVVHESEGFQLPLPSMDTYEQHRKDSSCERMRTDIVLGLGF